MGLTNSVTISGAGLNTDGFVIDLTFNHNSKVNYYYIQSRIHR